MTKLIIRTTIQKFKKVTKAPKFSWNIFSSRLVLPLSKKSLSSVILFLCLNMKIRTESKINMPVAVNSFFLLLELLNTMHKDSF